MQQSENKKAGPHGATRILVDYFCFTVGLSEFQDHNETEEKAVYLPERIEKRFYLSGLEFQERKGMYGYAYAKWYDGIVYAWGGNDTVYVQMSGTGCRTWETTHPGLTWEKWIKYLQATYATLHISRLDIACDTFGLLKLRNIQAFTRAGNYISRWKTFLIQEGSNEMAVIWGSSKSDFRLRIYDKTLERTVKGSVDADKVPKDWVRCEFQLRNDAAASFVRAWQSSGSIGSTFLGIMKNQLLYVTAYDGKNRDRATVARWWDKLLGDAEQIHMAYDAGKDYNFDSLKRYIFHQAGSSIKAYLKIMDGDFGPLLQGVEMSALNDRQTELIRSAQFARREWQAQQIEYNKM